MINQENIDSVIAKFLAGEASPEEAMWLDDWKQENPENQAYFDQCSRIAGLETTADIDVAKAWKKTEPAIRQEAVIIPLTQPKVMLRVAASILLVAVLSITAFYMLREQKADSIYASGEKELSVTLNDGTKVLLAAHAELTATGYGNAGRMLKLKGNASFDVVHHEENPMVVDVGNVFVKDIGTRFSIRNSLDTDTVYVHVDEGIVLLFDSLGSQVEIKAAGNAMYIRSSKKIVSGTAVNTSQRASFVFNNNTLQEVIDELNRTCQSNIILQNQALKKCTITTRFTDESLETMLLVITETLGLQFEKNQNGYIIKGEACH